MAKINKYWGFVAVGALTAAAAGAVAALIAKKGSCKEDFDFEDDFDDFDLNEEKAEESADTTEAAEDFQAWEEHADEQAKETENSTEEHADAEDSGKVDTNTSAEVEIKDGEEEVEDADEPSHFEEAIEAASETESEE